MYPFSPLSASLADTLNTSVPMATASSISITWIRNREMCNGKKVAGNENKVERTIKLWDPGKLRHGNSGWALARDGWGGGKRVHSFRQPVDFPGWLGFAEAYEKPASCRCCP